MAHSRKWPEDLTTEQIQSVLNTMGMEMDRAYMAVPSCRSCRHWENEDDRPKGICTAPKNEHGEGATDLMEISDPYCALLTSPDFGCVVWEQKE